MNSVFTNNGFEKTYFIFDKRKNSDHLNKNSENAYVFKPKNPQGIGRGPKGPNPAGKERGT